MNKRLQLSLIGIIGIVLCALSAWVGANRAAAAMQLELDKRTVSGEVWKLSTALSTAKLIRDDKSPEAIDALEDSIDSSVCIMWIYHNRKEPHYSNLVNTILSNAKQYRIKFPREFQPSETGDKQVDDMRRRAAEILQLIQ